MHIAYDPNGNKVLKFTKQDLGGIRGFSIQTLVYLPRTHSEGIGPWTEQEVMDYIKEFGTELQKVLFGVNDHA